MHTCVRSACDRRHSAFRHGPLGHLDGPSTFFGAYADRAGPLGCRLDVHSMRDRVDYLARAAGISGCRQTRSLVVAAPVIAADPGHYGACRMAGCPCRFRPDSPRLLLCGADCDRPDHVIRFASDDRLARIASFDEGRKRSCGTDRNRHGDRSGTPGQHASGAGVHGVTSLEPEPVSRRRTRTACSWDPADATLSSRRSGRPLHADASRTFRCPPVPRRRLAWRRLARYPDHHAFVLLPTGRRSSFGLAGRFSPTSAAALLVQQSRSIGAGGIPHRSCRG